MTLFQNLFEGTNATSVTTANTGGASGDAFTAVNTTAPAVAAFDTSRYFQGGSSMKVTPSGSTQLTSCYWTGTGSGRVAIRGYFYFTAAPAGGVVGMWVGVGSSSRVSIDFRPTGKLRVYVVGGTLLDTTASYPLNEWVRVELEIWKGTTTTNGRVRGAMYSGSSLTAIESWDNAATNTGTDDFTTGRFGSFSSGTTSTSPFWIDAVGFNDAATGYIGPYSVALGTPVVTLGTTTNPTTVGGTNGSQVVTWPAISGAASYQAYIAPTATPDQSTFVLVASGVTSPYTFTGLTAGQYAFGIKAKV